MRMLNSAIIKFNHHIISKNEVIAAYEAGETLIGGGNVHFKWYHLRGVSP